MEEARVVNAGQRVGDGRALQFGEQSGIFERDGREIRQSGSCRDVFVGERLSVLSQSETKAPSTTSFV